MKKVWMMVAVVATLAGCGTEQKDQILIAAESMKGAAAVVAQTQCGKLEPATCRDVARALRGIEPSIAACATACEAVRPAE